MNLSFSRVTTVGSSGLVAGRIYFETSTGTIKVATSETTVETYGDGVHSASWSSETQTLTIVNESGETISVNFSDVASATAVATQLTSKLNIGASGDSSSTQSYYGVLAYVDSQISSQVSSVYRYRGSCTYAELPADATAGDVWNVTDAHDNVPAGTNYAWTGEAWDALAGTVDLSPYLLSADAATTYATKEEVAQLEGTDTTYTFVSGTDGTFTVTPSGGAAQVVSVGAIGSVTASGSGALNLSASTNGSAVTVSGSLTTGDVSDGSDSAVPTCAQVKTYVDAQWEWAEFE